MPPAVAPDRRLLIKRPRTEFLLDEIIRIEGMNNYSLILKRDGSHRLVSRSIRVMAERLPEFVRIHRKHLINPSYVATIQLRSQRTPGQLKMTNGDVLPVAKRRKHDVKHLLRQYRNAHKAKS